VSNDNTKLSRNDSTVAVVNGVQVREGVLAVPGELKLHFGGALESVSIAWRLAGPAGAPVVVAMGGISASRRVWLPDEPRGGWWHEVVGPGLALDTERYFVVCSNVIGGCQGSTGPASAHPDDGRPYGSRFPVVTVRDMVRVQRALADHLGVAPSLVAR